MDRGRRKRSEKMMEGDGREGKGEGGVWKIA